MTITGSVSAVLPSGEVLSGAYADVYVWVNDDAFKAVLDSACTASTSNKLAWIAARTELADSTGIALDAAATQDLRILRSLEQRPHAVGRADSTGSYAISGIPSGWYWIEAETLVKGELVQWWKQTMFAPLSPTKFLGLDPGINLRTKQFTHAQFCTDPEQLLGAAAFAEDDDTFMTLPSGERINLRVDTPASTVRNNVFPKYPEEMRRMGQSGSATLRFVVDTTGWADMGSVQVLQSDYEAFARAARVSLQEMRFIPAIRDGKKVRSVAVLPFQFDWIP